MRRSALLSAAVLFLLLAAVGLLRQQPNRRLTPTSYGTSPHGYKAVYDLLQEAGVPVARNLERVSDVPPAATLWFIEPTHVCTDDEADRWEGSEWLRSGGTAVVFLAPYDSCGTIAGSNLPALAWRGDLREDQASQDGAPTDGAAQNGSPPDADEAGAIVLRGAILPRVRSLAAPHLSLFVDARDWKVAAADSKGHPFALERAVGAGRLVVVADTSFLANRWLAEGDAAPLAMDLVHAYGAPLVDERDHGFRAAGAEGSYRGFAPALPAFAALVITGLAFVWWGAALPPPLARGAQTPAPTLSGYVQTLATLYARSRDFGAAWERYRAYAVSQLHRRLGLPPDAPLELVLARVSRLRQTTAAELDLLRTTNAVASEEDLRRKARVLDDLIRKASR